MNKTLKIFAICLLLAMVCGIFIGCEDLRWTYGVIRCRACYVDYDKYDDFAKTNFTAPYYILNMKKGDDNLTDVGYWILSDNTYDIQYEYRYTTVDFKPQGYVIALEFSFENNEKAYIVVNLSQYTSYESKYYDTSLYNYYSPKDYVEKTTADTLFSSLKYINANDIESINSEYEGSRYMVSSVLPPENLFVMLPDYKYEGIVEKYYKNDRDFSGKYTEYRYCDKELSDQLTSDTSISSSYPYGLITIYDNRSISEAERIDWHLDMIEKIQENLSLCYREK